MASFAESYGSQPALRRIEGGEVRPGMVVRVTVQQEDWAAYTTFRVGSIKHMVAWSKSGAAWALFPADGVHFELVEDPEMILRDELAERLALSSGFVWGSMPELSREHYRNLAEEAIRWVAENKEKK